MWSLVLVLVLMLVLVRNDIWNKVLEYDVRVGEYLSI